MKWMIGTAIALLVLAASVYSCWTTTRIHQEQHRPLIKLSPMKPQEESEEFVRLRGEWAALLVDLAYRVENIGPEEASDIRTDVSIELHRLGYDLLPTAIGTFKADAVPPTGEQRLSVGVELKWAEEEHKCDCAKRFREQFAQRHSWIIATARLTYKSPTSGKLFVTEIRNRYEHARPPRILPLSTDTDGKEEEG